MFSAIGRHMRVGPAGVIAVIALVFAMAGGAWAAKKYVITSTSQIKPSVLKSLQGKNGAAGAQGPAGQAGANGKDGVNGKDGAEGEEGSPWTAGGVLPGGETETGSWGERSPQKEVVDQPISFTLPLSKAPEPIYVKPGETEVEGCPGLKEGIPTADPGMLCVYAMLELGTKFGGFLDPSEEFAEGKAGKSGALLQLQNGEGFIAGWGVWAVTAE